MPRKVSVIFINCQILVSDLFASFLLFSLDSSLSPKSTIRWLHLPLFAPHILQYLAILFSSFFNYVMFVKEPCGCWVRYFTFHAEKCNSCLSIVNSGLPKSIVFLFSTRNWTNYLVFKTNCINCSQTLFTTERSFIVLASSISWSKTALSVYILSILYSKLLRKGNMI